MKSVSRRIVRADPFSFRNIEEEELPSTWGGISACMYTRPRGIQGSGQPLSRGGSRRIPSNPPRSAHSSFCSPPLALSTTDPVYHESRKSRAPFVPLFSLLSTRRRNSCTRTNRGTAGTVKYLHAAG